MTVMMAYDHTTTAEKLEMQTRSVYKWLRHLLPFTVFAQSLIIHHNPL
jgi:hypothetical protein